ncbi:hypothetical protein AKJ16_DCAP10511 [Drosera capensis]
MRGSPNQNESLPSAFLTTARSSSSVEPQPSLTSFSVASPSVGQPPRFLSVGLSYPSSVERAFFGEIHHLLLC